MSTPYIEIRRRADGSIRRETIQEGAIPEKRIYIRILVSLPLQDPIEIRVPVGDQLLDPDIDSLMSKIENYLGFLEQAELILKQKGKWKNAQR